MIKTLDELILAVKDQDIKKIAIASAEDDGLIELVKICIEQNIAEFILVGDQSKIRELLTSEDVDHTKLEIINLPDHKEAAEKAVQLVVDKKANVVMKGLMHTSIFLKAILDKEKGLREGNLISQVTVYEKADNSGLQLLTDCAMNISPNLDEKRQIINNAVNLARRIGYDKPKVAILSAIETVNPDIPDTMEAAVLSKMADRGQIKNAIVDGPFALDNAISKEAANQKGITGEVAGNADIIVCPNLQVGNALHKALTYYANKRITTAIMGTSAPIVMTSRTDPVDVKLLSVALAIYIAD